MWRGGGNLQGQFDATALGYSPMTESDLLESIQPRVGGRNNVPASLFQHGRVVRIELLPISLNREGNYPVDKRFRQTRNDVFEPAKSGSLEHFKPLNLAVLLKLDECVLFAPMPPGDVGKHGDVGTTRKLVGSRMFLRSGLARFRGEDRKPRFIQQRVEGLLQRASLKAPCRKKAARQQTCHHCAPKTTTRTGSAFPRYRFRPLLRLLQDPALHEGILFTLTVVKVYGAVEEIHQLRVTLLHFDRYLLRIWPSSPSPPCQK